jgi:hypothetical protein
MQYKVFSHFMPWDIDYAHLWFTQLKKSSYYLNQEEDKVVLDVRLNLTSYLIDWDKSKLPKEFFINKFLQLINIVKDTYEVNYEIYEGNELYGHLDQQKDIKDITTDFYISICPDMYFSEHVLALLINSSKQIKNKYFVLTTEIHKMWDHTWDEITNQEYMDVPYNKWNQADIYNIRANIKSQEKDITLEPTQRSKWAGWCDLYNKAMYEELCPLQDEWKGYGPYDWYSLMLTEFVKQKGVDFQQYVLRGQTAFEYSIGPLLDGGFSKYYKDLLVLKDVPNQRQVFESKMQDYLSKGVQMLQEKNII